MNTNKVEMDVMEILSLADAMAAAAATFNAHGYDSFISARDSLKEFLTKLSLKLA